MTSSEFSDWMTFAQEEPFGAEWENWLMAIPAHMFASAHSKKGSSPEFKKFFYAGPEAKEKEKQANVKRFVSFLDSKAKNGK